MGPDEPGLTAEGGVSSSVGPGALRVQAGRQAGRDSGVSEGLRCDTAGTASRQACALLLAAVSNDRHKCASGCLG